MTTTETKNFKIDDLMEQASESLARTEYFAVERLALQALGMAQQAKDYERIGRIVLPLQEARRLRFQLALEVGPVRFWEEPVGEDTKVAPGCWLMRPPLVGAEARRLRIAGFQQEVPLAVVCHEPTTRLGQVPIVAVGVGPALRTRIDPPPEWDNGDQDHPPSQAWFIGALEALSNEAVESVDPTLEIRRRTAAILDRLHALPESEALHHLLANACREAPAPIQD